jgi:hypothetical protein
MFKNFLSNLFGPKKETKKLEYKNQIQYSTNKTEQETSKKQKNSKTLKNKSFVNEVFEHFPNAKIISTKKNNNKKEEKGEDKSSENYEELLNKFEKIDKTDGLSEIKVKLSKSTIETIQKWKNAFNQHKLKNEIEPEDIIDVVIGFDFGTSSSKIIVNFPFNGKIDRQAFLVPKELRADNHEHCWKSILYYDNDTDYFDVVPSTTNMIQLSEIKTSLMNKSFNKILLEKNNILFKSEDASAVYLGCLLKLVKGWVISDIITKHYKNPYNCEIDWEVNVGFPAAKIDVKDMTNLYKHTLKCASLFAETEGQIKISNFYDLLTKSDQKINPVNIRPEVAAQSVGFIQSAMLDFGAYTVIDIGASTLDICFFNYINNEGIEKQSIFTANVDLLGAESINWIKIVNKKFKKKFKNIDLQHSIQKSFHETLLSSKREERAGKLNEWKTTIPVILCGGGKESKLHQTALNKVRDGWNHKNSNMIANLKFIKITTPEDLNVQCDINDYHRLSVAWGLSIEKEQFAKVELPKDIDDLPPNPTPPDYTDRFIGPEHI